MAILDNAERARRIAARYGVRQQQAEPPARPPQQGAGLSAALDSIMQAAITQAVKSAQPGHQNDAVLAELRALRGDIQQLQAVLATRSQPSGRGYTFAVERDFNGRMTRVHARPSDKVGQS